VPALNFSLAFFSAPFEPKLARSSTLPGPYSIAQFRIAFSGQSIAGSTVRRGTVDTSTCRVSRTFRFFTFKPLAACACSVSESRVEFGYKGWRDHLPGSDHRAGVGSLR
jgi:hypothetical protein